MESPAARLGPADGVAAGPVTGAFPVPPPDATAAEAETVLRQADWRVFDTERDLVPLRRALLDVEDDEGVTQAHRLATARLRERGALLRHPDGHRGELSSHALSPDGRYFAVGGDIGDDYDLGGTIQIWEVATGRCVNFLDGILGGVGWPSHHRDIQWSADSRVLAANFSGCRVGRWDPFADRVAPPLAEIDLATATGSREPVGFALDPDGSRVFLHFSDDDETEGSGVDACLVPLWRDGGDGRVPESEARTLARPAPELVAALNHAAMRPFTSYFSADGNRIWGFGEWHWEDEDIERRSGVFCVDVARRELVWFVDTGFEGNDDYDRMTVSPDGTMLALNHGETLEFLDAVTGRRLAAIDTPYARARLSWTVCEGEPRLAVIDAKDLEGVRIYQGTEHLCDLMQTPQRPEFHFPDGLPFAWSPDGRRAACLNIGGHVEIMTIDRDHDYVDYFDVPEDSLGLWWGADDVLVIAGPRNLMFRDLKTGETIGDFRLGRELPTDRPLRDEDGDLGEDFQPNPTFALDGQRWVAAFAEGVVIAPSGAELLDDNLAWSVDRRFSWPYRWGPVEPAPGVASCFDVLTPQSQQILRPLRDRPDPEPVAEWPPPDTAGLDDLYRAYHESVLAFSETWLPHVMDASRAAARQRARTGDAGAAEEWITEISPRDWDDYVRAQAEVALVLSANGNPRDGARLHCEAAFNASHGVSDHALPFVGAALGATFAALGRPEVGAEWIERAVAAIDPDPNPWQHRLSVCWALLEGGLEDRAREVWSVREPGSPSDRNSWLAHLVRIGRDDLVREFLYDVGGSWYDRSDVLAVFTAMGRDDLLRDYYEHAGLAFEDLGEHEWAAYGEAERNAAPNRPTAADIAELREARAALLNTPMSGRREDTKRLARLAAARGHYGAVLDLLKLLPYQDFDDQPATASRALWIAVSGYDGLPW